MASYDITLRGVSVTFSADKIREFLGIARPESPSYPDQEIADCLMLSNRGPSGPPITDLSNIMKEADSFEVSGVPYGLLLTNLLDAAEVPSHVGEDRQKPSCPIYLETLRKSRSQLKWGKEQ
ncbi:hypothetical protein CJ030_MR3G009911 [Morella rubra]|uniref:Uncharacterized protein n=1 Tax=Morella rubra TaxID=262757 RepID=A0A6A1W5G8_9ROSI|nr:hypothetical protein CJ030_MR3G009911 [Morella rubra]